MADQGLVWFNYGLLTLTALGTVAYALRVLRMANNGPFPLGGVAACLALTAVFFAVRHFGVEHTHMKELLLPVLVFFVHIFVAKRANMHMDRLYKVEMCALPLLSSAALFCLSAYHHEYIPGGAVTFILFTAILLLAVAYGIRIPVRRTLALGGRDKKILALTSGMSLFLIPSVTTCAMVVYVVIDIILESPL